MHRRSDHTKDVVPLQPKPTIVGAQGSVPLLRLIARFAPAYVWTDPLPMHRCPSVPAGVESVHPNWVSCQYGHPTSHYTKVESSPRVVGSPRIDAGGWGKWLVCAYCTTRP